VAPAGAPPVIQQVTTSYTYAPFDQLRTITDDHKNVTTLGYDVRGRKTSLSDQDRGTTTTAYFGTGQVDSVTYQNGDKVSYGYDDLGRATSRQDKSGSATTNASYVFDTADNGIGQPAYAISDGPDDIRIDYFYDDLGRSRRVDTTIDQSNPATKRTHSIDTSYDVLGRLDSVSYPEVPGRSRFAVRNSYNDHGYLRTIFDVSSGTSLWVANSRNADLALTGAQLGTVPVTGPAPITVSRGYDPVTGRPLTMTATSGSGAKLQDLSYAYYNNGLVHTRTQNDGAKRAESYAYDDLGRLTRWDLANNTAPAVTTNYGYDSIGNLTSVTGPPQEAETRTIGRPAGTLSLPHALTARNNESYLYDDRGRMYRSDVKVNNETVPLDEITYTAFDLPRTQSRAGQGGWNFRYDAYGTRTVKKGPDGSTVYVGGLFEDRTDAGGKHSYVYYLSGPDGAIGQAVFNGANTTVEYTLGDALGSVTQTADAAGAPRQSYFHNPYGTRTNADGTHLTGYTGALTHGFTGQEHDTALATINMNGRIYHPGMKTFLTPDLVSSPANPQTLHPYSYVQNNPTNSTDPSGLCNYCTGADPMQNANDFLSSLYSTAALGFGQYDLSRLSPGMDLLGIGPMIGLDGLNRSLTGNAGSDGGVFNPITAKINESLDELAAYLAEASNTWEGIRSYPIKVGPPMVEYDELMDSTLGDAMDFAGTASLAMDGIGEVGLIVQEIRAARVAEAALAADAVLAVPVPMSAARAGAAAERPAMSSSLIEAEHPFPPGTLVGELENGAPVYYGKTATAIGGDERTATNFLRSRGVDGHDLIVHGSAEGQLVVDGMYVHPQQVADALLASPYFKAGDRLNGVICHGACVDELEEILQMSIRRVGPDEEAWLSMTGQLMSGPASPRW
jgi:RHS repeat-associated protein